MCLEKLSLYRILLFTSILCFSHLLYFSILLFSSTFFFHSFLLLFSSTLLLYSSFLLFSSTVLFYSNLLFFFSIFMCFSSLFVLFFCYHETPTACDEAPHLLLFCIIQPKLAMRCNTSKTSSLLFSSRQPAREGLVTFFSHYLLLLLLQVWIGFRRSVFGSFFVLVTFRSPRDREQQQHTVCAVVCPMVADPKYLFALCVCVPFFHRSIVHFLFPSETTNRSE